MAAITLFLIMTLTVVFLNMQAGFAVYFNGEQIGSAKSMEDVSAVVTGAEQQLKQIYGQNYSLDSSISVSPNLGARADDTENLKDAILGDFEDLVKMYVIEVNGKAAGAAEDEKALDQILGDILSEYSTDLTTSIRFVDTVSVSYRYINKDITQDPTLIKSLLEPSNTTSAYRLTVENTEQRQHTEEIPYDVQYCNDSTVYEGNTKVKTKGVPGENLVTENAILLNGTEQSSQIVGTVMTKAPVAETVAVGTAPRPTTASSGKYIWPSEGIITSGFGPRTGFGSSNHQGIDIAGSYGQDIVAADGGEVILADWYYGYGLMVQIKHDNGDITYYGHCSELLVKKGDKVYQGQVIAQMGSTGESSGVHCHFEIRVNNTPVNPVNYLP